MNFELFKSIVEGFFALNGIPIFVTHNDEIVYCTLPRHKLLNNADQFFSQLATGITVFGDIEQYAMLPYVDGDNTYSVIVGPMFSAHPMTIGYKGKLAIEDLLDSGQIKDFLISIVMTGEDNFLQYVSIICKMTGNGQFDTVNYTKRQITLQSVLDKHITEDVFLAREQLISPYAPETEKRIMDMVRAGDVEAVKKVNTALVADVPSHKVSYLFKVVSLVTVCTRAVLDSGVDSTVAYTLSDRYLEKLGAANNQTQIYDIAKNVLPHFTSLVAEKREMTTTKYSPHLTRAESYIKLHLHYKFSLADVATHVGVSEKYLSRLFVTHKGEKFSQYVNRCRIQEAKELLLNTDTPLIDISYSLGFISESYFIKIFGQLCGMTPNAYRKRYKNTK